MQDKCLQLTLILQQDLLEKIDELDTELVNEIKKQAYRPNDTESTGYRYYSIMNVDIYRTLIAQEMVNSGETGINIEKLYVKSIQY